ncbi:MAG: NAD(P)/FAD-dependent oxidoreductase [Anaerolineae bacterium]
MNLKADAVVVGAGPAGSAAAYFLAKAGVKVLLLEAQLFPREKPCGEGVSARALAVLERMGLGKWLQEGGFFAPQELLLSSPDGNFMRERPEPSSGLCYGLTIPRLRLDETLVRHAATAGAGLMEGARALGIERPAGSKVKVTARQRGLLIEVETRLVLASDGAAVSFSRSLGLARKSPELVAVRAHFAGAEPPDFLLEIHYDRAILPGYGWVFPLGGGLVNVGVGAFAARLKGQVYGRRYTVDSRRYTVDSIRYTGYGGMRGLLERFIESNPHVRERLRVAGRVGPARGGAIRAGADFGRLCDDNVLVAGEAAGLVNPLTGEGISSALESGELAAEFAMRALEKGDFSATSLSAYGWALAERYGGEQRAAQILRALFSLPWVVNRITRRARVDKAFAQYISKVLIGFYPMRTALRPGFLFRLIF